MEEDRKLPEWALPVVGVAAVVALVVIGLSRGPAEHDPGTAEGTIQLYIDALVNEDFDRAASFWADDGCIPVSTVPPDRTADITASLIRVDGNDVEATVAVRITETSPDRLGDPYQHDEWFNVIRHDDSWQIHQPSWAYYHRACEEAA